MLVARLVAVPVLAAVAALWDCEGADSSRPPKGATLYIAVKGTGNGTVTATSSNAAYDRNFGSISCQKGSGSCTGHIDLWSGTTTVTLTAAEDGNSHFVSLTDGCVVDAANPRKATVTLDSERDYFCTATFDALSGCDNPIILSSGFEDDSVWERLGIPSNGSNPTTAGNPDDYRREDPTRNVSAFKDETVYALRRYVYDPADAGPVKAILYSEDRILLGTPDGGEGIRGGLFAPTTMAPLLGAPIDPPGLYFTGRAWARASVSYDVHDNVYFSQPFRVGYFRTTHMAPGTGSLPNGVDNVTISICR
jgi:hypothetical protein